MSPKDFDNRKETVSSHKIHPLDVLHSDVEIVDSEVAEKYVSSYYSYIRNQLEGKSVDTQNQRTELHDIFIDEKTQMVYRHAIVPSNLTKEVGFTIVQLGIKSPESVSHWVGLSQKERKEQWPQLLANINAIYVKDHGYGAGIPAEKPIIDGLAKGELIDPITHLPISLDSGDLVVALMTKGSGFTLRKEYKRSLPEYDMDATYAQLMEAVISLEQPLIQELVDYYGSTEYCNYLGTLNIDENRESQKEVGRVVLNLAELFSGNWLRNRMAVFDGHSMGGWEVIRAYLGETTARFSIGMLKYAKTLCDLHNSSITARTQSIARFESQAENKVAQWLIDSARSLLSSENSIRTRMGNMVLYQNHNSPLPHPTELVGQLADIKLSSRDQIIDRNGREKDVLRSILTGRFPNAIFESETPHMVGKDTDGTIFENYKDLTRELHAILLDPIKSFELRLLLGLRSINSVIAKLGYHVGDAIGMVDHAVGKFVSETAYGKPLIRATHKIGVSGNLLDGVAIDDKALAEALPPAAQTTIVSHKVTELATFVDELLGSISRFRLHSGHDDEVLKTEYMSQFASMMIGYNLADLPKIYEEHPMNDRNEKAGHYLPKDAVAKIWSEIMGRSKAIKLYRQNVESVITDYLPLIAQSGL